MDQEADILVTKKIYYALQIGVVMCFIGHGAFGIITKPIWCNYFAVFGIGQDLAYKLMPVVGTADILLGLVMLVFPMRAVPVWLVCWGLFTATLRPLSGESFAELIERAGNFGAPLALLILTGFPKNFRELFTHITPARPGAETAARLAICLRIVVFLLLAGHGWLNLIEKKGLIGQYTSLGFAEPGNVAHIAGLFEMIAACIVLIKPIRQFLIFLVVWKIVTECFYPHYGFSEWVERGGSYASILALWLMTKERSVHKAPHPALSVI